MPKQPLHLLIYDATCRGARGRPGLSHIWGLGDRLYAARGLIDASIGARGFGEAFDFLIAVEPDRPIAEIQFWGHGKWGDARIGDEIFDVRSLGSGSEHFARLSALRRRLMPASLFWLRTCESFGAERGRRFARALADSLGVAVAGHTYVIGWWQSGLHRLLPGSEPDWSPDEGLMAGTAAEPERALASNPLAPRTITALRGTLPAWA